MDKHKQFLIILLVIFMLFTCCKKHINPHSNSEHSGLLWVKEESHFIDYTINGDTIIFSYSFCFDNQSGYDIIISSFTASFAPDELEDWISYKKYYFGKNDQSEILLQDGEKVNIPFSFEGEYLGGEVNEGLSYPIDIVFVQRFAQSDASNCATD